MTAQPASSQPAKHNPAPRSGPATAGRTDAPAHWRPLIVAHRGLSWTAPENTLAAYRAAVAARADMAECDVYLTADGVPVIMHDESLKRTTGRDARVGRLTLEQIKTLDAGSWKASEYKGEPVPTLAEALALLKGHMRLIIELKKRGAERQVLETVREAGLVPQDVTIFSFHLEALQDLLGLEPGMPAVWLVDKLPAEAEKRKEVIRTALTSHVQGVGVSVDRADASLVRLARQCALSVFVWTANEPADIQYLARIGVDAIITDRPDLARELLERGP